MQKVDVHNMQGSFGEEGGTTRQGQLTPDLTLFVWDGLGVVWGSLGVVWGGLGLVWGGLRGLNLDLTVLASWFHLSVWMCVSRWTAWGPDVREGGHWYREPSGRGHGRSVFHWSCPPSSGLPSSGS